MSNEDHVPESGTEHVQHGSVQMRREQQMVYPDFKFKLNPAMKNPPKEVGYPLGEVPKGEDVEYAFEGEPELYPEMDFRTLANELPDGHQIPNTTYLTHSISKHPAIFIPHIPSYIIRQFSTQENENGDRPLILDPFSGSATTGVEAIINGRDYFGVEINPLSRLVGEVATSKIPPSLLKATETRLIELIEATSEEMYEEYDVEFLDGTKKNHWFESEAIRDLTRIRKATADLKDESIDIPEILSTEEVEIVHDLNLSNETLLSRVYRWLILTIANTVFKASNADPGVSKAYKSKKMRRKIEEGTHPPDLLRTHKQQLKESRGKLTELWNEIYDTTFNPATVQKTLARYQESDDPKSPTPLAENQAHKATADIRLGDARDFDVPEYKGEVDLAITSPPYINAMNYYRGSKLRLFWIYDFLEEDEKFDATTLRRSIIGSNSVSMSKVDADLPRTIRSVWLGTDDEYSETRLPYLDDDIETIHGLDHNSAEKKSYVTWKFFARDMLQTLTRVYEHLKQGAYFFFVIGENTIGERLIHSHKYIADIAQNLGKFEGHGGDLTEDEGYRLVGSAWDEITNRDLFQSRDHEGGVIKCEWTIILQKPL